MDNHSTRTKLISLVLVSILYEPIISILFKKILYTLGIRTVPTSTHYLTSFWIYLSVIIIFSLALLKYHYLVILGIACYDFIFLLYYLNTQHCIARPSKNFKYCYCTNSYNTFWQQVLLKYFYNFDFGTTQVHQVGKLGC